MQDKKSFGKYIAEKRKEANLTQEELASRLFVIPTTISKWERGITYPDITVITNLCKELNISEHEFFTACDDEALSKEKKEIKEYRTIKKGIFYSINLGYLIALISCFICNLVIDNTLSWFWIVLLGILIAFPITSLPFYLKKNKYRGLKVSVLVTMLVYILLYIVSYINRTPWLLESFMIATYVFALLWIDVLVCTFMNVSKVSKVAICLIPIAILTAFTNPVCARILNIPIESNFSNIATAVVMVFISVIIFLRKMLNK